NVERELSEHTGLVPGRILPVLLLLVRDVLRTGQLVENMLWNEVLLIGEVRRIEHRDGQLVPGRVVLAVGLPHVASRVRGVAEQHTARILVGSDVTAGVNQFWRQTNGLIAHSEDIFVVDALKGIILLVLGWLSPESDQLAVIALPLRITGVRVDLSRQFVV